jgi:hypothetical protein
MSDETKEEATDWIPLVGAAMGEMFGIVRREGRKTAGSLAQRGRERIELYQAKKDLDSLYQKLGRETVRLVEAGEITHPGLVEGAERIHRQQSVVAQAEAESSAGEE